MVRIRQSVARVLVMLLLLTTVSALGGITRAQNQATPMATLGSSPVASPTTPAAQRDYDAAPSSPVAWVELGPDGAQIARAITGTSGCPQITLDGASKSMQTRVAPDSDFGVTVCETTIPNGTTNADVNGQKLHLLSGTPTRVAVIGDTGCRLAKPSAYQGCDDPSLWPFAAISQQLADWQPDLIIHVGDYYYREDPCPAGNPICAGSPTGDTWASWNADFFTPAASLLPAAPWVFIRGNHETCERGGDGWFHFLDPRPMPTSCQTYTDPYAIPAGDVQLLVFDSSAASDGSAPEDQVAEYSKELAAMAQLAGQNAWFLTHRPIWGPVQFGANRTLAIGNATLRAASGNTLPDGVQLSLAGHIHLAEVLSFPPGSGRPPMFVVGNTGTELDAPMSVNLTGLDIDGVPVASGRTVSAFGYLTLESTSGAWMATAHDTNAAPFWACAVLAKSAACTP
ncbi:MAG TPA: metallophosphoesterase [Thermomicrobiales bacterium]|nr:metallophosphoesterase [Thermomicrobiales bacterium]